MNFLAGVSREAMACVEVVGAFLVTRLPIASRTTTWKNYPCRPHVPVAADCDVDFVWNPTAASNTLNLVDPAA